MEKVADNFQISVFKKKKKLERIWLGRKFLPRKLQSCFSQSLFLPTISILASNAGSPAMALPNWQRCLN